MVILVGFGATLTLAWCAVIVGLALWLLGWLAF